MAIKLFRDQSFFSSLLKSFIIFAGGVLALYYLLGFLEVTHTMVSLLSDDHMLVFSYQEKLKKGQFQALQEDLNQGNSLLVYNDQFQKIFGPDSGLSLSQEDLLLIPTIKEWWALEVKDHKGSGGVLKTISYGNQSKIILDKDRYVLYTDRQIKNRLSQREVNLLQGILDKDHTVTKHGFVYEDRFFYLLLLSENDYMIKTYEAIDENKTINDYAFVIGFLSASLFLIMVINKKVRKPLKLLSQAMSDFKEDTSLNVVSYKGPKEFMDICKSFNDMASRLRQAQVTRQALEDEKAMIISDLSHDLKTPLTVVKGFSQCLKDQAIEKEKLEEILAIILNNTDYMTKIIDDLNDYSKIDRPEFVLNKETLDLCRFADQYLDQAKESLKLAGLSLEVDMPKNLEATFDPFQLRRVFDNILSNCIKYHETGKRVFFKIIDGPEVLILIANDGQAIDPELGHHIFSPLVMADKARSLGHGTGLGLAISKKLLQAHGGDIHLVQGGYPVSFEIRLKKL